MTLLFVIATFTILFRGKKNVFISLSSLTKLDCWNWRFPIPSTFSGDLLHSLIFNRSAKKLSGSATTTRDPPPPTPLAEFCFFAGTNPKAPIEGFSSSAWAGTRFFILRSVIWRDHLIKYFAGIVYYLCWTKFILEW